LVRLKPAQGSISRIVMSHASDGEPDQMLRNASVNVIKSWTINRGAPPHSLVAAQQAGEYVRLRPHREVTCATISIA
jgi:hypothetical protein